MRVELDSLEMLDYLLENNPEEVIEKVCDMFPKEVKEYMKKEEICRGVRVERLDYFKVMEQQ